MNFANSQIFQNHANTKKNNISKTKRIKSKGNKTVLIMLILLIHCACLSPCLICNRVEDSTLVIEYRVIESALRGVHPGHIVKYFRNDCSLHFASLNMYSSQFCVFF